MKTFLGISCVLALLLCGWPGPRAGQAEELAANPIEIEYRQLERDIPSLYLINALSLSADQAKSLAALQADARRAADRIRLELNRLFITRQKELDQWLETSLRSGGDSGKTYEDDRDWEQIQKVRKELTELLNASATNLNGFAEKAQALLNPTQADILKGFAPCFIPPQDFRSPEPASQPAGDSNLVEKALTSLRESPPDKQEQAREKALEQLLPYYQAIHQQELTAEEMREVRDKLGKKLDNLLPRIRKMKEEDFQRAKAGLGRELVGQEKKKASAANARETRAKVIRYLLNPGVLGVLLKRSGSDPTRDPGSIVALDLQEAALQARGQPFRAVGLANELCLTPVQAGQLLPIVRAMAERRRVIDERARQFMQQALPVFRNLVWELADQRPSSQAETAAAHWHAQVKRLYEDEYLKELLVAEGQVDLLLAADQVDVLMLENKDLFRKSGTLGQGASSIRNDRRRAAAVFDAMDKSNPVDWRQTKHQQCLRFVEACLPDRADDRSGVDLASQAARAEKVLDRARSMLKTDYLQARDELAAELCPRRNQPRPAVYGWTQAEGDPLERLNPSTYLFFSPAMQTVLERVASRKTGV